MIKQRTSEQQRWHDHYLRNKERINRRTSEWQKANADKVKVYSKQWRNDNPDKVKAYKEKRQQREWAAFIKQLIEDVNNG